VTAVNRVRPATIILWAGVTLIVVAGDLHIGAARLLLVLAFMAVVPGWATMSVMFDDMGDLSTMLLLCIGVSVAVDVAVAEIALLTHAWNPVWMIAVLALFSMALATVRLGLDDRAQRLAVGGSAGAPATGTGRGSKDRASRPNVALRQEVLVTVTVLVVALVADAAGGGSLARLLAGAVGATIAAIAGAGCLVVVVRSQVGRAASRQTGAFWAAAALVAVVVLIVTVRFLVLG